MKQYKVGNKNGKKKTAIVFASVVLILFLGLLYSVCRAFKAKPFTDSFRVVYVPANDSLLQELRYEVHEIKSEIDVLKTRKYHITVQCRHDSVR